MKDTGLVLTLKAAELPNGFASLAASVLSCLQKDGRVFVYVEPETGEIKRAMGDAVLLCDEPCLVIPLQKIDKSAVCERTNTVRIRVSDTQVLKGAAMVLDETGEVEEEMMMTRRGGGET